MFCVKMVEVQKYTLNEKNSITVNEQVMENILLNLNYRFVCSNMNSLIQ